eukprot:6213500-Pleurochrysis_carterae.AAC.2
MLGGRCMLRNVNRSQQDKLQKHARDPIATQPLAVPPRPPPFRFTASTPTHFSSPQLPNIAALTRARIANRQSRAKSDGARAPMWNLFCARKSPLAHASNARPISAERGARISISGITASPYQPLKSQCGVSLVTAMKQPPNVSACSKKMRRFEATRPVHQRSSLCVLPHEK